MEHNRPWYTRINKNLTPKTPTHTKQISVAKTGSGQSSSGGEPTPKVRNVRAGRKRWFLSPPSDAIFSKKPINQVREQNYV